MAWVFLAGDHAFKLKKPVKYPFLDFSALESREAVCREEVRLNRRLAPETYLEAVPLTQDDSGRLSIAGHGTPIDWLVKMRRLPADRMLDYLIAKRQVSERDVDAIGESLSRFYQTTVRTPLSAKEYLRVFVEEDAENRKVLLQVDHNLPRRELDIVFAAMDRAFTGNRAPIEARASANKIVDGHGDLKPEHVCLTQPPVIIDCLEFNARLRMVDPFDELAYLGMECQRLGAAWIGKRLLDRCAASLDDQPPPEVLAFYTVYRCCLRARLAVAHLLEPQVRTAEKWIPRAREYLAIAIDAATSIA
jgi:aminoglycoside phosphotransferase family enzyme